MSSLRFGLVGTGYWARTIHAVALSGAADVQLAGVWGRDPVKTAALAEGAGTTGPHALAMLTATLGPVRRMTADHGAHDIVHLVLHHENAATSMATTVSAPTAAATSALTLWGEAGRSSMPTREGDSIDAYRTAVAELVAGVGTGQTEHPCDVRFGAHVVRLLADAQQQVESPEP